MHIKGSRLINKKVIAAGQGKELDTVKDVIYDPTMHKVRALLIDEGGWFSDARVIPIVGARNWKRRGHGTLN